MKEKKALSLKEPREEARFLQKVTIENDDDDDDEEENITNAGQGDLFNQLQSKVRWQNSTAAYNLKS